MKQTNKRKQQQEKNLKKGFILGIFFVVVIAGILFVNQKPNKQTAEVDTQIAEVDQPEAEETGESLTIAKSELTDQAKFYPVEVNGTKMEVLAFKASDGTIRTALNTCQVCYDSGRGYYIQDGNKLVCQNCGNQFEADQVEVVKGGCNPVPIMKENKTEDDTTITISEEFLAQNTQLFSNWKK